MTVYDELQWRGLVADCTDTEELTKRLAAGGVTLYCGFDPTADSLHVGNLVPLIALRRFQKLGHHPIALAGGATGMIGDPSGKSAERTLLTRDVLQHNIAKVKEQLKRLLDFETTENPARLMDNADWFSTITFLEFLRDVGKNFTVNMMVAKESVRARMEDRDVGISYTEFSYMLLQAYDFYHLAEQADCSLQIGGSDQWGNITAGIDLSRKKAGKHVFGLTLPLITNADGSKFGKSVSGAVWLDPEKTSPYKFYQFWINTQDGDAVRYLRFFTFLDKATIDDLAAKHEANPAAREAQRALAKEMTDMIHGEQATEDAIKASQILFGADLDGISEAVFSNVVGEVPTNEIERASLEGEGATLIDLLVASGLSQSKGQARKDIQGGGVNVNNKKEQSIDRKVTAGDLLFGQHLLLRKGKKNYVVLTAK